MDNQRRSQAAQAAVDAHSFVQKSTTEPLEVRVGDLLCDLAHLCDEHGFDLAALLQRAEDHHAEEVEEAAG